MHIRTVKTIKAIKLMICGLAAGLVMSMAEAGATLEAGLRMMTVPGAQPISVALFYPTQSEAHDIPMGVFLPHVALNAASAASIKGLILISHGTGGSSLGHHNLAQRLAQDGYLVAALEHPGDNWRDHSMVYSAGFFSERPRQVSRVLDALLADPEWKDKIPAGHIGALGHSAGGFSVLALVGGIADPLRLLAHCRTATDDAAFCGVGGKRSDVDVEAAKRALKQVDFDVMDRRIRAVIAMAPVGFVFAPESLQRIDVPLKIYTAEHDVILNGRYHGGWLHAQMPGSEFEEVKNAGHFAFMARLTGPVASETGDPNDDPTGFDRTVFHRDLENDVVAFFDRHFR